MDDVLGDINESDEEKDNHEGEDPLHPLPPHPEEPPVEEEPACTDIVSAPEEETCQERHVEVPHAPADSRPVAGMNAPPGCKPPKVIRIDGQLPMWEAFLPQGQFYRKPGKGPHAPPGNTLAVSFMEPGHPESARRRTIMTSEQAQAAV